jgi:hypothetical protein
VGKLVLVNEEVDERGNTTPVCVRAKLPITAIRPCGLYLVTGGAGGFGSQIVNHIASLGARHIVVTVTRDPRSGDPFLARLAGGFCDKRHFLAPIEGLGALSL